LPAEFQTAYEMLDACRTIQHICDKGYEWYV
jgi:hypothetical protein